MNTGTNGNDTITIGQFGDNLFEGLDGDDLFQSDTGFSINNFFFGNDTVDGGDGFDVIDLISPLGVTNPVTISGDTTSGIIIIQEGNNPATLEFQNIEQILLTLMFGSIDGSASSVDLFLTAESVPAFPTVIPPTIIGGSGNDTLIGGSGTLAPDLSNEQILTGGAGNDTFSFREQGFSFIGTDFPVSGVVITDFEPGDLIDLSQTGFDFIGAIPSFTNDPALNPLSPGEIGLAFDGNTTVLQFRLVVSIGGSIFSNITISNGAFTLAETFEGSNILRIVEVIEGTNQADLLTGTENADNISGLANNDTINALNGDDFIDAGLGFDEVFGNAGNDSILGGGGFDTIFGNSGNDTIDGGAGADNISGNLGDDLIFGRTNNDILSGGSGNDTLIGESGADSLSGGDNNDSLDGGAGNDSLFGDTGNDTLDGGRGQDSLVGDIGDDLLNGDSGADILNDNEGDDVLNGGLGFDTLTSGIGNDTLFGGQGRDSLDGGDGDDFLNGGTNFDTIVGGLGNDTLIGESGGDVLIGNPGTDFLDGGGGADTLDGGADNDTLNAGAGRDSVIGQGGDDLIDAGSNLDTIIGGGGNDTITGGSGGDLFIFEGNFADDVITDFNVNNAEELINLTNVTGIASFQDLVDNHLSTDNDGNAVITDGNNTITLLDVSPAELSESNFTNFIPGVFLSDPFMFTDDLLVGGGGDDTIQSFFGNDTIFGGLGDDLISFSGGQKTISGGAGQDIFDPSFFSAGLPGSGTITDFELGIDTINLFGTIFNTFADLGAFITSDGTNTTITIPNFFPSIILENILPAQLSPDDFLF